MKYLYYTGLSAALAMAVAVLGSAGAAESSSSQQSQCNDPVVNAYRIGIAYQRSAEAQALQLQAYNVAMRQLAEIVAHPQGLKAPAVVLDLDDTVISNVPLEVQGLKDCFKFDEWAEPWTQWVQKAKAPLIPGAGRFLHFADAHGVHIFYVSNRLKKNKEVTIKNLHKLDLPQVSKKSVVLIGDHGKTKKERRSWIEKDYDIVMLVGDSLHDLSNTFDASLGKAGQADFMQQRHAAVTRNANKFGSCYILIPNSAYGSWTPGGTAWAESHVND
jgi:5'-nucleotidase (lipoprotein e(P4) family)